MVFYDIEVFKYDWLVVIMDMVNKKKHVVINDADQLTKIYEEHKDDIWVGFNNKHYDQYIFKSILLGMNPKTVNDAIIIDGKEGWSLSNEFRNIKMINYDVMPNPPIGLKTLEGFMGSNIKETDVDFNIDRKLTPEEIEQTIKYCTHDVEQTIEVFMKNIDNFNAMMGIVKAFNLPLECVGDSESRITAKVLGCQRQDFDDEFDIEILPCIQLKKYKYVQEWFETIVDKMKREHPKDWEYHVYKQSLSTMIAGVPHTFGFGGLHGASATPIHRKGSLWHVDVNNYYPSLLIAHGLVTRAATNDNFKLVYDTRKELKYKQTHATTKEESKKYKQMQLPYKKLLNSLTGGMKDKTNPAYDPRNNNRMCINGQLMLLDLIEHLEVIEGFELIQSNTDGLIVMIPDTDEAFNMMDDICWDWECRCSTDRCDIRLETDALNEIYQKDVNNYLWVDYFGGVERKGAYVKELSALDNDLPILNKALVEYMVHKTPVETTINNCNDLIEFQKIVKLSSKYHHVEHEHCKPTVVTTGVRVKKQHLVYESTDKYTYKAFRVFASQLAEHGRILKCRGGKKDKFGNTPEHCFIFNDDVNGVKCPWYLDKQYYITLAKKRLKDYGIET